jgi:hypothetical protein
MKAPRKSELLRLQALYKTDARIADALAVPEYLVAYWRRKKGLPRYSAPKFSREQIEELWARYGDDFRCGRELNISKAAYYSWRRRYGILERPAVLKLEQLELRLAGDSQPSSSPVATTPKTGTRKILDRSRHDWPDADAPADWRLAQAPTRSRSAVALMPGSDIAWPRSAPAAEPLPRTVFTDPVWISEDCGLIEWQLVDARAVVPGQLVLGPRGIAPGIGGIGALYLENNGAANPPRVLKVELTRKLGIRVDVEDVVLTLLERGVHSDWDDAIVEFLGVPIERLSIDRKVKLCALTVHFGAHAAFCPFDDVMRRHFGRLLRGRFPQSHPDRTAVYDGEHFLESRGVTPKVARHSDSAPHVTPASGEDRGGVIIGPAALPYEIETVAGIVRGRRIAAGQPLLVCPATAEIYRLSQRKGWTDAIVGAGGSVLDVSLYRHMGHDRLIDVATCSHETVYCTRPLAVATGLEHMRLSSPRTAAEQLQFV